MSSTWFAAVLAFAAGLGGAVQIAVQGRLGERVGSLEALTTAAVVGGLIALAALLLVRRSVGGVGEAIAGPKWQLLGGAMGVFIVFAITVAGSRIGIGRQPRFSSQLSSGSRLPSTATGGSAWSESHSPGRGRSASACSSSAQR